MYQYISVMLKVGNARSTLTLFCSYTPGYAGIQQILMLTRLIIIKNTFINKEM